MHIEAAEKLLGDIGMHLEMMRLKDKEWREVEDPLMYSSARIWFCKFRSLAAISQFRNLKTLVIAGLPDSSLNSVSNLVGLEYLQIVHMPKIMAISPTVCKFMAR